MPSAFWCSIAVFCTVLGPRCSTATVGRGGTSTRCWIRLFGRLTAIPRRAVRVCACDSTRRTRWISPALSDGGGRDRYPKHYTDNSNFHDRFLLRKCEVFTDSDRAVPAEGHGNPPSVACDGVAKADVSAVAIIAATRRRNR